MDDLLQYTHEPVRNALSHANKPLHPRSNIRGLLQEAHAPSQCNDCHVLREEEPYMCSIQCLPQLDEGDLRIAKQEDCFRIYVERILYA